MTIYVIIHLQIKITSEKIKRVLVKKILKRFINISLLILYFLILSLKLLLKPETRVFHLLMSNVIAICK
jgi:hypothetical protein